MKIVLTLEDCEAALSEPAEAWVARCHEIACRILDAGLVTGRAAYGHWTGPVHPSSYFADRGPLPFVRHGWIVLNDRTGEVFDPTRWVFEAADPYLFVGKPRRGQAWPYDEGGNAWRRANIRPMPETGTPAYYLELPREVRSRYRLPQRMSLDQVFWLANLPYDQFGDDVAVVYNAITKAGQEVAIPWDNRQRALLSATTEKKSSGNRK